MSLHALRLPMDGEPEVLADDSWDPAAVAAALGGTRLHIGRCLDWSPTEGQFLFLQGEAAPPHRPANPAALALAGERGRFTGPVLVTARRYGTGSTTGLSRHDLLIIGTRLLVGEAAQGAIGSIRTGKEISP